VAHRGDAQYGLVRNSAEAVFVNAPFEIIDYGPIHRHELVEMWRASFEEAVGVVDPHPFEEQLHYFDERVLPENRVVVVLDPKTSSVIAFMASTPQKISQLYVHVDRQRQGIGSILLNRAKRESEGVLRLFTFRVNRRARRFYEHHGFRVVRFGFEEHWQLEDVEYEWSATIQTT